MKKETKIYTKNPTIFDKLIPVDSRTSHPIFNNDEEHKVTIEFWPMNPSFAKITNISKPTKDDGEHYEYYVLHIQLRDDLYEDIYAQGTALPRFINGIANIVRGLMNGGAAD